MESYLCYRKEFAAQLGTEISHILTPVFPASMGTMGKRPKCENSLYQLTVFYSPSCLVSKMGLLFPQLQAVVEI